MVLIAEAVFLLQRGQLQTDRHKDATAHSTHAPATAAVVGGYSHTCLGTMHMLAIGLRAYCRLPVQDYTESVELTYRRIIFALRVPGIVRRSLLSNGLVEKTRRDVT